MQNSSQTLIMILRSDESFSRLDIFSRNHLVPSLTWDKSSDTELGSSASREHDFFKFAKCMHHKCWIHIKLLDFINVNVNEYKFMKKKTFGDVVQNEEK